MTERASRSRTRPTASAATAPSRRRTGSHGAARPEQKKGSLLRELPVLLVIAFVLALLVKTFFVQAFFIPSGSMEKTLHGCPGCTGRPGAGQQGALLVRRPAARRHRRVQGPGHLGARGAPSPSRATGSPVRCCGWAARRCRAAQRGRLRQAGHRHRRPDRAVLRRAGPGRWSTASRSTSPTSTRTPRSSPGAFGPVTVPPGPAVGDGRPPVGLGRLPRRTSATSTSGTIAVDDVIGKAAVIVWPLSRLGVLHAPDIQGDPAAAGAVRRRPSAVGRPPAAVPRRRLAPPTPPVRRLACTGSNGAGSAALAPVCHSGVPVAIP